MPDDRAPLHRVAAHVFAVAVVLLVPGAGVAQTVDLGGHAGFHLPVGSLVEGPPIEKRLLASLSAGLDAFSWVTGRVGFAGKVTYSSARVAVTQPGNVQDRDASVILANARILFAITPLTLADGTMRPMALFIGAGAGLVNRSGAIWAYESGLTSPALVLNLGAQTPAGPRMVMRIEVEDYISTAQFNVGEPSETAAQTHHDVTLSLSLCYRVLH